MLLQQKWQFVQHVTPGVGPLFAPLEEAFRNEFILDLLGFRREEVTDSLHKSITWGVKWAVIGISKLTQTTTTNFKTSEH